MNRSLLSSINKRAKANDILYILGDVAYKNEGGFAAVADMIASLRCRNVRLIMVHGHIHGSREDNERNAAEGVFRYDYGVDANDYAPVHISDAVFFELPGNSAR